MSASSIVTSTKTPSVRTHIGTRHLLWTGRWRSESWCDENYYVPTYQENVHLTTDKLRPYFPWESVVKHTTRNPYLNGKHRSPFSALYANTPLLLAIDWQRRCIQHRSTLVGHHFMFQILTEKDKIIHRSCIRLADPAKRNLWIDKPPNSSDPPHPFFDQNMTLNQPPICWTICVSQGE